MWSSRVVRQLWGVLWNLHLTNLKRYGFGCDSSMFLTKYPTTLEYRQLCAFVCMKRSNSVLSRRTIQFKSGSNLVLIWFKSGWNIFVGNMNTLLIPHKKRFGQKLATHSIHNGTWMKTTTHQTVGNFSYASSRVCRMTKLAVQMLTGFAPIIV